MSSPARRIELIVDELVLHGFDPRHGARIADAVRVELAAALEGWSPDAGVSLARVDAGSFTIPTAAPPPVVGRGAARKVGQILHRGTDPRASEATPRRAGTPEGSS
jgi:hypothetical protein